MVRFSQYPAWAWRDLIPKLEDTAFNEFRRLSDRVESTPPQQPSPFWMMKPTITSDVDTQKREMVIRMTFTFRGTPDGEPVDSTETNVKTPAG